MVDVITVMVCWIWLCEGRIVDVMTVMVCWSLLFELHTAYKLMYLLILLYFQTRINFSPIWYNTFSYGNI